ncbi:Transmembrane channel-like protein 7 [Papilio machaon]|uniref:Transmembrane channel-like protein 7 n=1 Tax=Papilio machaon TaxID=76193 RepID=A0A194RK56_PAPMA|nr:Transmembrane channel-like protein 7 [Papilio machaon]
MSGGNASKNKARSSKRQEGWEEAGGEFYQELYPGGEQELFENLQRADAAKLATLLPSKQARNTTTVKRGKSQNERRQSTFARTTQSRDIHLSMLPDLSAYILVPIAWALLSLVAIVKTGAKGFKEKLVENEGQFYLYCNLVFGGWDFCVHNAKSAKIKHKALFNEIKGCLQEERASKSKSLFMSVLLLGFVISIGPVAYSIAEMTPSSNCGPFKAYGTVWDFVITTFNMFPPIVREIVFLIGTSTFAVPAFAISLFLLYYYWAVATANRHMVSVLRNQLVLEGHDKQFLLNRLSAFIRQHQKRCERRNRASFADDDSSIRQESK